MDELIDSFPRFNPRVYFGTLAKLMGFLGMTTLPTSYEILELDVVVVLYEFVVVVDQRSNGDTGSMFIKAWDMFSGATAIVGGSGDNTPKGCVK